MSTKEVWDAVRSLADVWRESEIIQQLRGQLPGNNSSTTGIPEMLQNIDAGTGLVSTEPLLTNKWVLVGAQLPLVNFETPGLAEFFSRMQPVGFAAECNTAWLRSRLPAYPLIPVPHLTLNTHLTSTEICPGLGWRREALQGGLQFESTPRGVAQMLGLAQGDHDQTARGLAHALEAAPQWRTFTEILSMLTEADRRQLKEARRILKPLLTTRAVDNHEPDQMLRRHGYRRDQVADVVNALDGRSRELARSFEEVSDLIDLVSLRVLGQLVAYKGPVEVSNVEGLEREGRIVRFRSADWIPRGIVRIADPLTPDVAIITGISCHIEETGVMVNRYEAEMLLAAGTF